MGVLKFGTVSWELDTIKHHGLDAAEGIDLQVVELASNQATQVALQGGAVDMIVSDWLWVSGSARKAPTSPSPRIPRRPDRSWPRPTLPSDRWPI